MQLLSLGVWLVDFLSFVYTNFYKTSEKFFMKISINRIKMRKSCRYAPRRDKENIMPSITITQTATLSLIIHKKLRNT